MPDYCLPAVSGIPCNTISIMEKLIQMSDFVKEIETEIKKEDYQIVAWQVKVLSIDKIFNYANFLKMPLEKWMFSQIDKEDGESLFKTLADTSAIEHHILQGRLIEYLVIFKPTLTQKAKDLIGI